MKVIDNTFRLNLIFLLHSRYLYITMIKISLRELIKMNIKDGAEYAIIIIKKKHRQ